MHSQKLHVFLAFAKRRDANVDDIQAIKKVFSESLFFNFFVEVFVSCSQNPHIGVDRTCSAEALELAILQNSQQFHLKCWTDLADLIEKQRSSIGQFKSAFLPAVRAGESSLLISEQFRFEESVRKRGAAHLNQRLQSSRRRGMNRVGDHFLAGSTLACDQNCGGTWCHLFDHAHDISHLGAGIDDPACSALVQLLPQLAVFTRKVLFLSRFLDSAEKLGFPYRLRDEVIGALFDRLDGDLDRAMAGDHDDLDFLLYVLRALQQFHTVHDRKAQIRHNDVDVLFIDDV